MRVLVVGGAGYIGSHMVKQLSRSGHEVVVLDNLTTGLRSLALYGKLIVGDLGDAALLERLFREYEFDGVMHFAASSLLGSRFQILQSIIETMWAARSRCWMPWFAMV